MMHSYTSLTPVYITKIKLNNFRSHKHLSLAVDQRHVILIGKNGAGKTNLLEAISFLSPGKGLRRAVYSDVAMHESNGLWSVFVELQGAMGSVSIGTGVQKSNTETELHRQMRIDGTPVASTDALLNHLRVIWLVPTMNGLFTGPARDRRRYLDRLVLTIDPAHGKRVSSFERLMRSRNKLLLEKSIDINWLDAIELQMAECAVAIAAARMEANSLLSSVIVKSSDIHASFPDALIHLNGTLESLTGEKTATDLETEYTTALHANRRLDAVARRTLQGPHRTDVKIYHRPKSMPVALCSTGEQKAILIGLMLAHARLIGEMHGYAPIILLDEITAHLDKEHRLAMFDTIDQIGCQTWMSGTDRELFASLGEKGNHIDI